MEYVFNMLFLAGSERNYSRLTFDGVDLMGERLAEEVIINNQHPFSFLFSGTDTKLIIFCIIY